MSWEATWRVLRIGASQNDIFKRSICQMSSVEWIFFLISTKGLFPVLFCFDSGESFFLWLRQALVVAVGVFVAAWASLRGGLQNAPAL